MDYSSVGMLSDDGDTVKISYEEAGLEGLEGCIASLIFRHDSPWLLTMLRSGALSTALVFNGREKRQLCSYETGIMDPFEIAVCTRRIANSVTIDGGRLELEYWIELRGVKSEYTCITIDVVPVKPDGVLNEHIRLNGEMSCQS